MSVRTTRNSSAAKPAAQSAPKRGRGGATVHRKKAAKSAAVVSDSESEKINEIQKIKLPAAKKARKQTEKELPPRAATDEDIPEHISLPPKAQANREAIAKAHAKEVLAAVMKTSTKAKKSAAKTRAAPVKAKENKESRKAPAPKKKADSPEDIETLSDSSDLVVVQDVVENAEELPESEEDDQDVEMGDGGADDVTEDEGASGEEDEVASGGEVERPASPEELEISDEVFGEFAKMVENETSAVEREIQKYDEDRGLPHAYHDLLGSIKHVQDVLLTIPETEIFHLLPREARIRFWRCLLLHNASLHERIRIGAQIEFRQSLIAIDDLASPIFLPNRSLYETVVAGAYQSHGGPVAFPKSDSNGAVLLPLPGVYWKSPKTPDNSTTVSDRGVRLTSPIWIDGARLSDSHSKSDQVGAPSKGKGKAKALDRPTPVTPSPTKLKGHPPQTTTTPSKKSPSKVVQDTPSKVAARLFDNLALASPKKRKTEQTEQTEPSATPSKRSRTTKERSSAAAGPSASKSNPSAAPNTVDNFKSERVLPSPLPKATVYCKSGSDWFGSYTGSKLYNRFSDDDVRRIISLLYRDSSSANCPLVNIALADPDKFMLKVGPDSVFVHADTQDTAYFYTTSILESESLFAGSAFPEWPYKRTVSVSLVEEVAERILAFIGVLLKCGPYNLISYCGGVTMGTKTERGTPKPTGKDDCPKMNGNRLELPPSPLAWDNCVPVFDGLSQFKLGRFPLDCQRIDKGLKVGDAVMPIFTAGYFNHNNIGGAQNTNRYHTKDAASFHLIAIILIAREGRRNDSYPGPFPPKLPVLVPTSDDSGNVIGDGDEEEAM